MTIDGLDASRYPTVAKYLSQIAGGLAAHPECVAKASLLRSILDDKSLPTVEGLPPELVELVLHPPPQTAWVPEVHFRALMRAVFDAHFDAPSRFYEWAYVSQKKLLEGPLYRILFFMVSPERVAQTATSRWEKFHRGIGLSAKVGHGQLRAVLTHPPFVADAFDHHATLEGVRAALELAGAKAVATSVEDVTSTRGVFGFTWR
jgi:hypothetical protein